MLLCIYHTRLQNDSLKKIQIRKHTWTCSMKLSSSLNKYQYVLFYILTPHIGNKQAWLKLWKPNSEQHSLIWLLYECSMQMKYEKGLWIAKIIYSLEMSLELRNLCNRKCLCFKYIFVYTRNQFNTYFNKQDQRWKTTVRIIKLMHLLFS